MPSVLADTLTVSGLTSTGLIVGSGGFQGNIVGNLTGNGAGTWTGPVIGNVTGNATGLALAQQVESADGAITIWPGDASITKASIANLTITAPVNGTDDGKILIITAETAFAHVLTCASVGFNGKNASGTLTWAAVKGNGVILKARGGQWWVVANIGVTVA